MKYLITGAGGQLGMEWVQYAQANDLSFSSYTSTELDITDEKQVAETFRNLSPDVVINCAAYTKVDLAEKEIQKAYSVNAGGVKNLASACNKVGAKLVHFSTDYVFSGVITDKETYPGGYPEDAGCNPINVYGESKREGEILLQQHLSDFLLIRVSWLCGQFGSNFVKTMLRLAESRNEISVVDDQFGSPSYAFDVVEKTDRLIKRSAIGMYHISSYGMLSWADYAEEIFRQMKLSVKVKRISSGQYPVDADRPAYSLLCNKKMENAGIKPLDWRDGLSQLLQQIMDEKK